MPIQLTLRNEDLPGGLAEFDETVERVVIGRDPDQCQVVFPREMTQVGRQHVALERVLGRYRLVLNRDNPVEVDGQPAVDGMELKREATLRLGPGGPLLSVRTTVDDTLPGTALPSGSQPGIGTRLREAESAARSNRTGIRVAFVAVVVLGVLGYLAFAGGSSDREKLAELVVERERLSRQLAKLEERQDLDEKQRNLVEETRTKLDEAEKKLTSLNKRVVAAAGAAERWAKLATSYEEGIFLVVSEESKDGKVWRRIGTAFCIREDGLLATNAHVVHGMTGNTIRVYQAGTGKGFGVKRAMAHPRYAKHDQPDVGLIELKRESGDDPLPVLPLASREELRKVQVGTQIGTLGFPGEFIWNYVSQQGPARAERAHPTFKSGFVGRVTDYDMAKRGFDSDHHVQHSAATSGGCSGSPLFNSDGKVIAVHHAGKAIYVVGAPRNGQPSRTLRLTSASALRWGVRVDELEDLWDEQKW